MFGLSALSRTHRLTLGVVVLLIVNIIWVASSELTEYIFKEEKYDKPFFTSYTKTTLFMVYLLGFLLWKPWRQQCRKANGGHGKQQGVELLPDGEATTSSDQRFRTIQNCESEESHIDTEVLLSEPIFVPIKFDDKSSGAESDDQGCGDHNTRTATVRFSNLSEVRQLSDIYAEEASIARLSYNASVRAEEARLRALSKLSLRQVAKLSFIFSILWFFANFSYQEALRDTEAAVVNVLSSTSGLFTLVCAAIYPSSSTDRFSLSKLTAVLLSISGVVLVSVSDISLENGIPVGALWGLGGAILYALYLVILKRKVDHEDKLDIPMFFGFVGFFNAILLWPGFFILHYSRQELFEWPSKRQWMFITINGLVGTVLSELLWLWGCFLTSSLIGTLALSLTMPMTLITDVLIRNVSYSWLFLVGTIPVFLSFFAVTLLTHYENWDPVMIGIRKFLHCVFRQRQLLPRLRDLDREQTESLIGGADITQKVES